jgi:hypothetical protein
MKKLIILVVLSFPFHAFTQVKVGIRGGMNFANFIERPAYPEDKKYSGSYLTRINAELILELPLNDNNNWFINTGLGYSGKGNRNRGMNNQLAFDTVITYLNYIELPVTISYKFSEGNDNRFILAGGPYAAYGFKGKVEYYKDPDRTEINLHHKNGIYKRMDVGFIVNASYEIKAKWGIQLAYSRSLFDISRNEWKENNNVFGFSLFWYILPLFKGPAPNSTKY